MLENAREHLKLEYGEHAELRDERDPVARGATISLCAWSDADHASNKADRRSTTGALIMLGRSILLWRSKRQIGCEGSRYASELRAAAWTARELRGLRMFLRGIGAELSGPSVLYLDNEATVFANTSLPTCLKVRHLLPSSTMPLSPYFSKKLMIRNTLRACPTLGAARYWDRAVALCATSSLHITTVQFRHPKYEA